MPATEEPENLNPYVEALMGRKIGRTVPTLHQSAAPSSYSVESEHPMPHEREGEEIPHASTGHPPTLPGFDTLFRRIYENEISRTHPPLGYNQPFTDMPYSPDDARYTQYSYPVDEEVTWGAAIGFGHGEWKQFLDVLRPEQTSASSSRTHESDPSRMLTPPVFNQPFANIPPASSAGGPYNSPHHPPPTEQPYGVDAARHTQYPHPVGEEVAWGAAIGFGHREWTQFLNVLRSEQTSASSS